MISDRDLIGPAQSESIIELVQSILSLELIQPSKTLWLGSAWISDIPILNNRAFQFSSLEPDWPAEMISLSSVLLAIVKRGTQLIVITRNDDKNENFLQQLKKGSHHKENITIIIREEFHEKGLLADDYELFGTMNFTFKGITTNDERIVYQSDKSRIAERHITAWNKYGGEVHAASN
jgi:phosphatidylserine/phosphatidylglycerophosphate/cardiolipin synthase-like enzyme